MQMSIKIGQIVNFAERDACSTSNNVYIRVCVCVCVCVCAVYYVCICICSTGNIDLEHPKFCTQINVIFIWAYMYSIASSSHELYAS